MLLSASVFVLGAAAGGPRAFGMRVQLAVLLSSTLLLLAAAAQVPAPCARGLASRGPDAPGRERARARRPELVG